MGLVKAKLALMNPAQAELQPVEVDALADSAACICAFRYTYNSLGLEESMKRSHPGRRKQAARSLLGPHEIRFKNRVGFTGALVLGDEVLLGAIPWRTWTDHHRRPGLGYQSKSPNVAMSVVK